MMAKVAWITGASTGIGREVALGLARGGWTVAASSRTESRLLELTEAHGGAGRMVAYPVDVTDRQAMLSTAQRIHDEQGGLDLAIFNAGDYRPMPLDEFDVALFEQLIHVNYLGVVYGVAAVLPIMRSKGQGEILVMASTAGYRGLPRAAPYGASKAALIHLAEALKPELDAVGVRLRLINPGFVKTRLTDKNPFHMPAIMEPAEAADAILKALPKDKFEITFPMGFSFVLKALRCLPYSLYFRLTKRLLR